MLQADVLPNMGFSSTRKRLVHAYDCVNDEVREVEEKGNRHSEEDDRQTPTVEASLVAEAGSTQQTRSGLASIDHAEL